MAATAAQLAKAATATTALIIKGPAFAEVYINLSDIYIYIWLCTRYHDWLPCDLTLARVHLHIYIYTVIGEAFPPPESYKELIAHMGSHVG